MVLEKLYGELVNLTKTTDYFHMGGDEVNMECWKQFFRGADLKKLWCEFM
jgi:N-acetyl-beta-hexosaminidase